MTLSESNGIPIRAVRRPRCLNVNWLRPATEQSKYLLTKLLCLISILDLIQHLQQTGMKKIQCSQDGAEGTGAGTGGRKVFVHPNQQYGNGGENMIMLHEHA